MGHARYPMATQLLVTADGGAVRFKSKALEGGAATTWPTKLDLIFQYAIFLPEPANGIKLSIGCLAISA